MMNHTLHVITLATAMVATSTSFAQDVPPNIYTPAPKNNPPEKTPNDGKSKEERQKERQEERRNADQRAGADLPASFYKASQLMGLAVEAKGGDKIGDIRNIAINADNGRIRYAIVDGGKGTLYPIPFGAMKFANNRQRATVDTTTDRMKDAPTFKTDGWGTIGDSKWGKTVYEFYGLSRNADDDKDSPDFVSGSAVIGAKVETRKGDGLGSVKDVMVDTDKSSVAYAVLDFGRDNKLFAVPWQSMTVKDSGKKIVMRGVDRDDLKDAPGFPNSRWPNYKDLGWGKDVNYDTKPPVWIYGLTDVSGGNGGGGGGGNGGDRGAMGGWQANSKYSQLFNKKSVDKWKGTIVRTDSVVPLKGMDAGVALIVKTENSGNMQVQLGPEWFVKHQQDKFAEGDAIEVLGSKVDVDQKTVIMATQIRMGGRSLTLRNADGVPAWDAWQERK